MDLMQKLGGRKFLMALAVIIAAIYMETHGGLSVTMSSFLVAVIGCFNVANYAATAKHMTTKSSSSGGGGSNEVSDKLNDIKDIVSSAFDPESQKALVSLLSTIGDSNRQVGSAVLKMAKDIELLKRG